MMNSLTELNNDYNISQLTFSVWLKNIFQLNSLTELNNDYKISQLTFSVWLKNTFQLGNRDVYSLDILSTIHEGGVKDR